MTSEQATFFHPISSPPFIWNIALHLAAVWKLAGNKKKKGPQERRGSPIRVLLCRGSKKTNELETLVVRFTFSSLTSPTSRKRSGVGGQGRQIISFPFLTPRH